MKKIIAILSALLITTSIFAMGPTPATNNFQIKAQVEGKLFHGFSLDLANDSDSVKEYLEENTGDVVKDGIKLESSKPQTIGYYNLYTTEEAQAHVDFAVSPLSYTTGDDTYYVPFALSYATAAGNDTVSLGEGVVGSATVATLSPVAEVSDTVMETKEGSTGLRWNVLQLHVTFAGEENESFGLPEAQGDDYYTSTIVASIVSY